MVKVGINGFGRIGRNVLRAALNNPDIQIVAINDLTDSKTLAHLLKYDSLLGKLDAEVTAGEGGLVVDGKPITVFSERNPASIPWRQCEVDIVIEATGLFTDREKAAVHIHSGGAKRVIISAPGKNDDLTIVMGVNDSLYSPDKHYVVSNGSCTTNGLAPAAQVLHQHFGIKHGLMNTTHAYTNSQALHDQPEKDLRGARAVALHHVCELDVCHGHPDRASQPSCDNVLSRRSILMGTRGPKRRSTAAGKLSSDGTGGTP